MELTQMTLTALPGIPLVRPGDDLATLILQGLERGGLHLQDGDILVVAQKIVSKAEGRAVRLADVTPSEKARELAATLGKDPRHVQVILDETKEIVRLKPGTIIVEERLGLICANAGVDRSNVAPAGEEEVLCLPLDPDASARRIREGLRAATGREVGVIICDSHNRPWRNGVIGVAIGVAGIVPVEDWRGRRDLFGYTLHVTTVGVADMVASAATLLMGQADEGRPVILVRGAPHTRGDGTHWDCLRPREEDLFR
jgi:coenzyme F420-0:L-glutamate ligase/coenzyme F420-1:gamma-L-glutamate ligase